MVVYYARYLTVKTQLLFDNKVHVAKTPTCFDLYIGHFQGRSNSKPPCWGK